MKRTARPVGKIVESSVPARLDALPWSGFHTRVIVALGITWVLDGLEVTLAGAVSGALKTSPSLQLSDVQVGLSASAYLAGAVLGALLFGWLTDLFGRKRLFFVTLGVYILATCATALCDDFATFAIRRFMTGAGIGGEYSAINSAIQELTRHAIGVAPTWGSTEASGWVPYWARLARACCCSQDACLPTSAGEWHSARAQCLASGSSS
jgi:MFS family permease